MAITPLQKKTAAGATAGIVTAIIAFTAPFEGESHVAYRDPVGVLTICDGETQGVHVGQHMTHQQCMAAMAKRVPQYLGPVDRMMPSLTTNQRIAFTDFAWNEGVGRLEHSGIPPLMNHGQIRAGCDRLLKFDTAGGHVYPGLSKRRKAERELCLKF